MTKPNKKNPADNPISAGPAFFFSSNVDPSTIIDGYTGARQRHGLNIKGNDTSQHLEAAVKPPPTPSTKSAAPPASAFKRSAAVQLGKATARPVLISAPAATSGTLPDLTKAYLEQLIGWYREYEGLNPRERSKHVWIKNAQGAFYPSPDESWVGINQSIKNRERNVETDARDLHNHIHAMRVPLTKEVLDQLLDWNVEKTGKPRRKNSTVWLKNDSKEGNEKWSIAPYRWNEIEREFGFIGVRERLGAESLDQYVRQRNTARIDAMILSQGPLQNGPRRV